MINNSLLFTSCFFFLLLLPSFAGDAKRVTPKELQSMLEKKETVILIDVRTPEEHNDAHIPGSILMPLDTLGSVKKLPEDGRIVLYCRSGKRSLKALEVLSNKGFKDLTDLEGGIQGWAASGGEVISEPKK